MNKIPFFFESTITPDNSGFPLLFDFEVEFVKDYGMFLQKDSDALSKLLKTVYEKGTLADGSFSSGSGKIYLEKIVNYLTTVPSINQQSVILEVGFGSGIILKLLKENGFQNLTGLEPGAHPKVEGLEGIHLINDFFPSKSIVGKFDMIYSLLVLEHIPNPVTFLESTKNALKENGKLIIAVPNCESHYEAGDIGMFAHEHYGYYTPVALKKVAALAGFETVDMTIVEGAIMATLVLAKDVAPQEVSDIKISEEQFWNKVSLQKKKIQDLLQNEADEQIAVYTPIRGMNLFSYLNKRNVRLVDDNAEIQGKYLPGFSQKIESLESICNHPPHVIFICSRTFGHLIKEKCLKQTQLRNTKIIVITELTEIGNE